MASFVGNMLIETGHMLQRVGWRAMGETVISPARFQTVGVRLPQVANSAVVDPSCMIIGNVSISEETEIGKETVIRADSAEVCIGMNSKIGEGVVITACSTKPLDGIPPAVHIGEQVSIGNKSLLQSCMIADGARIGDNVIVSEGAFVESNAVLEQGAVVLPGCRIPAKEIWGGNPAAFVSEVHDDH